jgi:hypothetical protein
VVGEGSFPKARKKLTRVQSAVTYGTQKLAVDGPKGSAPCARELARVPASKFLGH